jgi:hypothetical protein
LKMKSGGRQSHSKSRFLLKQSFLFKKLPTCDIYLGGIRSHDPSLQSPRFFYTGIVTTYINMLFRRLSICLMPKCSLVRCSYKLRGRSIGTRNYKLTLHTTTAYKRLSVNYNFINYNFKNYNYQ